MRATNYLDLLIIRTCKFCEVKTNPTNPFFLKRTTFLTFTGTHGKSNGKQGNPEGRGLDEHDNIIGKIGDDEDEKNRKTLYIEIGNNEIP